MSSYEIVPCRSDDDLRAYIDEHGRPGHVLARDRRMFDFQYRTPWVDRDRFPGGTSVLCAYRRADQRLAGFLGAIVAPYPRPQSYWLALWHVLPELKGTGEGGRLLQRMQAMALDGGGWIGTFGAGPQALPVYLRRGYAVRAVRRWIFSPGDPGDIMNGVPAVSSSLHSSEVLASEHWFAYRYERHPVFRYKRLAGAVFRSEVNAWGVATHVVALSSGGQSECDAVVGVYEQTSCRARELGVPYLMDAWAFERPGRNWSLLRASRAYSTRLRLEGTSSMRWGSHSFPGTSRKVTATKTGRPDEFEFAARCLDTARLARQVPSAPVPLR